MPPFSYQPSHSVYNNSIEDQNVAIADNRPRWVSGPQTVPHTTTEQLEGVAKFGLSVGALGLLGRYQFTSEKRGWDYLIHGIRAVEEYSPGRVFRTFQASHMLSVLETPSIQSRFFSTELLAQMRESRAGRKWLEHLERVAGKPILTTEVIAQGIRFEGGQILTGATGGQVLVPFAGVVRAPTGTGTRFQEAYARSIKGGPLFDPEDFKPDTDRVFAEARKEAHIFSQQIKYLDETGKLRSEPFMFVGGKSRLQFAGRFAAGYGTSLVERMNQLARAPFELPIVSDIIKKLPVIRNLRLGVVPSSGLKTIAKLTGKLGLLGYGGYLGYQEFDYAARESELLDNTIFAEGISAAIGTVWTRSQMATSQAAEFLGLHTYREKQEEIAPGSTSFQKLIGFPITGALTGLMGSYAWRMKRQIGYRRRGLDIFQSSLAVSAEDDYFRQAVYGKEVPSIISTALDNKTIHMIEAETEKKTSGFIGKSIHRIAQAQSKRTVGGAILRGFGQLTPGRLGWMTGATLGAAAVLPFLPGALVPSTRPEELEELYSGKRKVAIRKGSGWEFGRCNTAESLIKNGYYNTKSAKDIQVGDKVISSDGTESTVVEKYSHFFEGKVYGFKTPLRRVITNRLTGRHIVPILPGSNSYQYSPEYRRTIYIKKHQLQPVEVPAENIRVGDYVAIPIPLLPTNCISLNTLDWLKDIPVFIQNDRVYCGRTYGTGTKLYRSGASSLPIDIELDYDLGLLFGYFLAQGNISFHRGVPSFIETVHAVDEIEIRNNVLRIALEKFGVKGTVRYKNDGPKSKEGCWIVRLCSTILTKLFYRLFFLEPYCAENKRIPDVFLQAPILFKEGLVDGYQQGDGHTDHNRSYISSSRPWLIDSVLDILLSLGYLPACPQPEDTGYVKKDGTKSIKYKIEWNKADRNANCVQGFIKCDGLLYCRVEQIEVSEYSGQVYDFEVDHPSHLYQAGVFLVHNSPFEGSRIDRYEQHWYPQMLARAKEKVIWGDNPPSPMERWWIENFTYELEQKHYQERVYPMCFHPDTPVYTDKGFQKIKDIEVGDRVFNKNAEWTTVIDKSSRICWENELIEIGIASDNRKLQVTPSHKILALKNPLTYKLRGDKCCNKTKAISNGQIEWVQANQLSRHDFVVLPVPDLPNEKASSIDLRILLDYPYSDQDVICDTRATQDLVDAYYSNYDTKVAAKVFNVKYKTLHQLRRRKGYKRTFPRFLTISDDLAYLFGFYLAEGWTKKDQVCFSLSLEEKETYAKQLIQICAKLFGANWTIKPSSENGIRVTVYCNLLARLLDRFFGKKRASEKTFSLDILKWPISCQKAFLKALFRGDGSSVKSNELTFVSASSALVQQIRLTLLSLGITSSFRKIVPSPNGKKTFILSREIPRKVSYVLSITGRSYEKFSSFEEELNCIKTAGDRKGIIQQGYFFVPIRQIKRIPYDGEVYDITVEETSSFLTTCIVHNSGTAFEDVPLIGPLLAGTIGKVIKPPAIMHAEKWHRTRSRWEDDREVDNEVLAMPLNYGQKILPGEEPIGAPISPYGLKGILGEQAYRMTEIVGLPGFTMTQIKEALTGTQDLFDQEMQIETSRHMFGAERALWEDFGISGALGTSEILRRLYPHRRRQIELYNPIPNAFADVDWLPGEGERSPNFKVGDPFCISHNTDVLSDGNWKKAKDVRIGDKLISHTGKTCVVKNKIIRKIQTDEKVYKIKITSVPTLTLEVSEDHPLLKVSTVNTYTKNNNKTYTNKTAKRIYEQLLHNSPCSAKELSDALPFSYRNICKVLNKYKNRLWTKNKKGKFIPCVENSIEIQNEIYLKEDNLSWIFAKDLKVGDYVAYPKPKFTELINTDAVLDLSLFCKDLAFDNRYIYIHQPQNMVDIIEFLETQQSAFQRGELKQILSDKGWSRRTFESAQASLKKGIKNRIPRYINPHDKDWGIISGYYLAEASVSHCQVSFAFHINEKPYHNELLKAVNNLFGITGKVYKQGDTNGCSVVFCNKALSVILPQIFGHGFDKKRAKGLFWKGSYRETLRTLFNGDGSFFIDQNKDKYSSNGVCNLNLKLENLPLLNDIREILLSLGFVGSLDNNKITIRGLEGYRLAQFLNTKIKDINLANVASSCRHSFVDENYIWLRVFDIIELNNIQEVIGFEVDGDNSFCAGGVATHNTKIPRGESRLPGPGYCIHPETKIWTSTGFKEAQDIQKGDLLLTSQGFKPVINKFTREYSGELISIKSYGSLTESTKLTPEHKIKAIKIQQCKYHKSLDSNKSCRPCKLGSMCLQMKCQDFKKNNIEWIEAQTIEKGDYVTLPNLQTDIRKFLIDIPNTVCSQRLTYEENNLYQTWREWKKGTNQIIRHKKISLILEDNELTWYMFGLYIAEGSLNNCKTEFALSASEDFIFQNLYPVFGGTFRQKNPEEPNSWIYSIYNKILSVYLNKTFGKAESKKLPANMNRQQFVWLLNGWLQGDGGINKETYTLTVSTKYTQLLGQLLYYLAIFNIDCSIRIRPARKAWDKKKKKWIKSKESYEITICASSMHNFNLIGNKEIHLSKSKTISNFCIENHRAFKVREVKKEQYVGLVYDFEVKDAHEFTTSFIIHNSALHPELRNIAPADYPLMHRFAILADTAPYTDKYKSALGEVRHAISRGLLSKEEQAQYKEIVQQVQSRKQKRQFTPYKYRDRSMTEWEQALAVKNEAAKEDSDEPSWFASTVGTYWEQMAHNIEMPLEFLTPMSPAAKLIHMRTAVEDYKQTQVVGTENAFWGHPIRDFFAPFFNSVKSSLGSDEIPESVQEKRDLEEYFDILKYVKYTRLKRAAIISGDSDTVSEYEEKRRETLFGINPYTFNFSHIYRALPRRDRDYLSEFTAADLEERDQILALVPENEKALLMARWQLKDRDDMKKAIKAGVLNEEQVARAEEQIKQLYEQMDTEGFPKDKQLWAEYLTTRLEGESYPDWYRRTKLLIEELEGRPLPGPDWVGWSGAVDLEDVKLKIVENMAGNMYDYDLWPDRQRDVARRPFLEEAVNQLQGDVPSDYESMRERILDVLSAHNINAANVTLLSASAGRSNVDLDLEEDRTSEIKHIVRSGL